MRLTTLIFTTVFSLSVFAGERGLVASLNKVSEGCFPNAFYNTTNGPILVSWSLLPTDSPDMSFDLYIKEAGLHKLNTKPLVNKTCFIDEYTGSADRHYVLCNAADDSVLDEFTLSAERITSGLPYITISVRSTEDIDPNYTYNLNDGSIGDLDGDGIPEIVVRREISDVEAWRERKAENAQIWEAYRLDGTFMWRILSGPNISNGNSPSFAVYDFDGDGRCEVALRTCEGFTFADGTYINDANDDGIIDYRDGITSHIPVCPDYITVIDGETGTEIVSAPFIPMVSSEQWGDDYYKRASSLRVAVARTANTPASIIIARGIYARMEIEAYTFDGTNLNRQWNWHSSSDVSDPYYGQGFHSLSVGDIDGDGYDEIVYGACTINHDGTPLYTSALGHGDALHLGKFITDREGLQIWSCFENDGGRGGYQCDNLSAALRDAATGEIIWSAPANPDNPDCGRALVADIDPDSPGCEMWYYKSNVLSADGKDLGYPYASCNMAIWFDGGLCRQQMDGTEISTLYREGGTVKYRRPLRMGKFGATNSIADGLKNWPIVYGDFLGDWREEIVMPSDDQMSMMIFISWYPTEYAIPTLRSDHVYDMSIVNQNVGYNMPTQLGWYLNPDNWNTGHSQPILSDDFSSERQLYNRIFNIQGLPVDNIVTSGYYIIDGKLHYILAYS